MYEKEARYDCGIQNTTPPGIGTNIGALDTKGRTKTQSKATMAILDTDNYIFIIKCSEAKWINDTRIIIRSPCYGLGYTKQDAFHEW